MRTLRVSSVAFFATALVACVEQPSEPEFQPEVADLDQADNLANTAVDPAIARGRDIWFKNTYGGEKFFTFLANHPDPAKRVVFGFRQLLDTPRAQRFTQWGVVNDPDCRANPAGGQDLCADPAATGVVGIRQAPGPGGTTMYGLACASCHAGFDPVKPPANPAEPKWANIHASIGNQYAKFDKIFTINMAATDPRRFMVDAWPDGATDTTVLFTDNIMNPGVVTAFWNHPSRPTFDVDAGEPKMRNGQGGEDDLGGDVAALRVFTNIGACFAECVAGPMQAGQPIDIDTCYETCPDMPPQTDLDDMTAFLGSLRSPRNPAPIDRPLTYLTGHAVFDHTCAGCHSDRGRQRNVLSDDEVNALVDDPANATNACRALASNWEDGKLWAQFSSQLYKDRTEGGDRGYRTMPLAGIWSTSPFLHNQSIGAWAPVTATPAQRSAVFRDAMNELLKPARTPVINVLPVAVGPFPAGTPLHLVYSRDPATGQLLCDDLVENKGHHYGATLPSWQKAALIYWLERQ